MGDGRSQGGAARASVSAAPLARPIVFRIASPGRAFAQDTLVAYRRLSPFRYTPRMLPLTPKQRRELRARAHPLHPVVAIGHSGLTPAVLHEIDVALAAHELIKVRVHSDDRTEREAHLSRICESLGATPVQHLGKLLIVWRPAPSPAPEPRPRAGARPGKSTPRRGERPPPPATGGRRHGPPAPPIGARAARHRRGTARQAPAAPPPQEATPWTRRRRADVASQGAGEPRRRTAGGTPPGAKVARPVDAQRRRPTERKPAFGHASTAAPGSKRPPGAKRPPAGGKRPPATPKPRGTSASAAPAAVRRRRRPTGGR